MTIPYNPLEHPRDPDRRCKVLVSTRGAEFSAAILKGACLWGEMPARSSSGGGTGGSRAPLSVSSGRRAIGFGEALPGPRENWYR